MNFDQLFEPRLDLIRSENRYRVFADYCGEGVSRGICGRGRRKEAGTGRYCWMVIRICDSPSIFLLCWKLKVNPTTCPATKLRSQHHAEASRVLFGAGCHKCSRSDTPLIRHPDHLYRASYGHRESWGVAFTNAIVLLAMNNDTSNVTRTASAIDHGAAGLPFTYHNVGVATVDVGGGAPVTFTNNVQVFANNGTNFSNDGPGAVGFTDLIEADILDTANVAFATYDLTISIGPISGLAGGNPGRSFPTSGGAFILDDIASLTATFTATTSTPVPEPPSIALLGLGLSLAVLGLIRHLSQSS
jgi:hypothetical protein